MVKNICTVFTWLKIGGINSKLSVYTSSTWFILGFLCFVFFIIKMKQISVMSEKATSGHNFYLVIDPSKLLIYGLDTTNRRRKLIIENKFWSYSLIHPY